MKIVFIGAGNVATQLAIALKNVGENIVQIFSKTTESAKKLAILVNSDFTNDLTAINPNADIYFYAVTDNILPHLIKKLTFCKGIHIHTAGSLAMNIFEKHQQNYGVLYPLQTFSKNKKVNFQHIPFFIESSNNDVKEILLKITQKISTKIFFANSERRQKIHLAAVFACNFTNHMFSIAENLLDDIPFEVLMPLITETTNKIKNIPPLEAQTGPAKRNDTDIIKKHLQLLANNPVWQHLYQEISEDIINQHKKQS